MSAREQPPAPPLSDAALSRIERGVLAALDRDAEWATRWAPAARRRLRGRAVVVLASAVAAAALMAARHLGRAPGLPPHGARIVTATSPSHLTVEGAAIDVAPSSAITFVDEREGATVIRLERGTVTCEVAPRGERAPFVVEAGTTRVTVVGTGFGVTRVGDHAQVWVAHGTVEVGDDGVSQLVHAGERYVPGAAGPAGAVANGDAPEAALPAAAATIDVGRGVGREVEQRAASIPVAEKSDPRSGDSGRLSEDSGPLSRLRERARERADLASRGARRSDPLTLTLSPAADRRGEGMERARGEGMEKARGEGMEENRESRPAAALSPEPPPPAITSAALRERFESAAALEVRDPLAAARIYRELASGSGAWAANALFAEARLSVERGHREAARTLLSAYLDRFPSGPNAADARALLIRLKGAPDEDGALR
jgi:hypothetical protein